MMKVGWEGWGHQQQQEWVWTLLAHPGCMLYEPVLSQNCAPHLQQGKLDIIPRPDEGVGQPSGAQEAQQAGM